MGFCFPVLFSLKRFTYKKTNVYLIHAIILITVSFPHTVHQNGFNYFWEIHYSLWTRDVWENADMLYMYWTTKYHFAWQHSIMKLILSCLQNTLPKLPRKKRKSHELANVHQDSKNTTSIIIYVHTYGCHHDSCFTDRNH